MACPTVTYTPWAVKQSLFFAKDLHQKRLLPLEKMATVKMI